MGEYNVKYNIVVDTGNSASQINALSTAISNLAETSKQKVSEYQQHIGGLQTGVYKPVADAIKYLNPLQEKFDNITKAAMNVCTLGDYFKEFAQETSRHITVLNKSLDTTIVRLGELHRQMNKLDGGAKYFNRDGNSFSKMFGQEQVKNLNDAANAMTKATLAAQGKVQPPKPLTDEQIKANSISNLAKSLKKIGKIEEQTEKLPKALTPFEQAGAKIKPFVDSLNQIYTKLILINEEMARFNSLTGMNLKSAADRADKANRNANRNRQTRQSSTTTTTGNISNSRNIIRRIRSSSSNSPRRLFGIGNVMYGAGFPFPDMIGAGLMGMGIMHITKSYAEYEKTMTMAKNILKSSDADLSTFDMRFKNMSANIRQIGVDTKFTTTEVAGAAKYLAMAGMGINDINNSMKSIASLAIITDAPLDRMADVVTNIQTAYGISSDKMPQIADILTSVSSSSNTNVLEMGEAMKFAAPMMSMGRISFNEAAAAVGALANAGLKGTVAGTALRAMMTRLLAPTAKGTAVLQKYNIQLYELDKRTGKNKLRSLTDIFTQLNERGASVQDLIAIFDKIGGNAANNLFTELRQLPELVNRTLDSTGMANRVADEMQNTIQGKWDKVVSQFTESGMKIYEAISPILKGGLDQILVILQRQDTIQFFAQLASGIMQLGKGLLWFVDVVSNNWGTLSSIFITWFATNKILAISRYFSSLISGITGTVSSLRAAITVIGTAGASSGLVAALSGLGGVVALALGGLATYGLKVYANMNLAKGKIEELQKQINDMRGLSLGGENTNGKSVINTKGMDGTAAFLSNYVGLDVTATGITDEVKTLLQKKGEAEGWRRHYKALSDLLSMSPSQVLSDIATADQIIKETTALSYLTQAPKYKLTGKGGKWRAFDPNSWDTATWQDKSVIMNDQNAFLFDVLANPMNQVLQQGYQDRMALVQMIDQYRQTGSIPYGSIKDIMMRFGDLNIDDLSVESDPQKISDRLNEAFKKIRSRVKGAEVNAWIKKMIEGLPTNLQTNVPPDLLYSSKDPKIDAQAYQNDLDKVTGGNSSSGLGKVQADPTKRITLNIQNLIGSFTVEYNGPEDQAKIKDIVMQTIIDAANEATMGLMSQS